MNRLFQVLRNSLVSVQSHVYLRLPHTYIRNSESELGFCIGFDVSVIPNGILEGANTYEFLIPEFRMEALCFTNTLSCVAHAKCLHHYHIILFR